MSWLHYQNSGRSFCKVYVGGLGNSGTQQELEHAFSFYGPLRSVWIARNPPGFAFIEFEDPNHALDAVRSLDGSILCGCRVRVEIANNTSHRSSNRPRLSQETCYACGELGHYARDCSQNYVDDVESDDELDINNTSHRSSYGPRHSQETCYACGELGHYARDCQNYVDDVETDDELDANNASSRSSYRPQLLNQERCYACGEIGHYARDCSLNSVDDVETENGLHDAHDHPSGEFGDPSDLCLDPETYEGCDWNTVIELMGIQPNIHNQRNHHSRSNPNNYQEPSNQCSRNVSQLHNSSERSLQGNWFVESPPQRIWFNSSLQQRFNRSPQQNRSNRPQQRNRIGNSSQPNQSDRPPQEIWIDSSPQRADDRQGIGARPSQQNNRSQQRNNDSTPSCSTVSHKPSDTSQDIKCAICLDTEEETEMKYIPCGHGFHAKCCNAWLSRSGICPVCRTVVEPQSNSARSNTERNIDNILAIAASLRSSLVQAHRSFNRA